jgi:ATP-dependent DNA helicase HFM1/MER3
MPFNSNNPFLTIEDDDIPLDTFGTDGLAFSNKCCGPNLTAYTDRELLAQLGQQDLRPVATARGGLLHRFTENCKTFSFYLLFTAVDLNSCLS